MARAPFLSMQQLCSFHRGRDSIYPPLSYIMCLSLSALCFMLLLAQYQENDSEYKCAALPIRKKLYFGVISKLKGHMS